MSESKKEKCNRCSKVFVSAEALAEHKRLAHPAMVNNAELENAAKTAMYEYLTSDGSDTALREKSKHASNYISGEARREAARNNFMTVMIAVAGKVTENREEFVNVLQRAMPDLPVMQVLSKRVS